MNKTHEKYYIPIEQMKMDREEYNYRSFCIEFDSYTHIFRDGDKECDLMKELDRSIVQHNIHAAATMYSIDRGDFAKVNNLEGLKCWYDMIIEYRKRLNPKDLYIDTLLS